MRITTGPPQTLNLSRHYPQLSHPQGVKKNIFKKYFDEFNTYALMVSPVSPSRAPPAFRSGGGGSVASAPATPTSRRSLGGGAGAGLIVRAGSIARGGGGGAVGEWDAPWTPISAAGVSTTHVPSEWDSPRPRWAVGRRKVRTGPVSAGANLWECAARANTDRATRWMLLLLPTGTHTHTP